MDKDPTDEWILRVAEKEEEDESRILRTRACQMQTTNDPKYFLREIELRKEKEVMERELLVARREIELLRRSQNANNDKREYRVKWKQWISAIERPIVIRDALYLRDTRGRSRNFVDIRRRRNEVFLARYSYRRNINRTVFPSRKRAGAVRRGMTEWQKHGRKGGIPIGTFVISSRAATYGAGETWAGKILGNVKKEGAAAGKERHAGGASQWGQGNNEERGNMEWR
ncbi:hypothetical protein DBV15_02361 [Temnothorax longispinosus]|uniref:Uncharacterized protein n=1 Tax=Temnothorax longispinosus TaxID=300112 RepID=A0A4S2JTW6_9HYME|nr:hypothetical protein DBV15_02361 [Temnothorax longispinosus]